MKIPVPVESFKRRLLEEGVLTETEFEVYRTEAERKNQNLIEVIASGRGINADYLYDMVSKILGIEKINFSTRPIHEEILKLLPEDISRSKQAIVFDKEPDGTLDVAMADPGDLDILKYLSEYLKSSLRPFLALPNDLNRGYSIYGKQTAKDFQKIIESNIQTSLQGGKKTAEEAAADISIVNIVDTMMSYAMSLRSSDIHIEVLEEWTLVRYRIDGVLHEIFQVPKAIHPALVARVKLLSGLKIDEHFKPQDGRFRYQVADEIVDVRVSIMPTYFGEKIVLRLLESSQKPMSLEQLGLLPLDAKIVAENLKKTFGMILVCGPTGSGKSTTLYGLMNIINRPNVNIVTIEDPIEYNMRYVNQSQINSQAGITFASGLRAFLRQDPNVIMVGEIRDSETAEIAVQAALTGHLLFSTLHTNDAPTSVVRLIDLGVPQFLVSSVLNLIIAQRLVRKICPVCIQSLSVDENLHAAIQSQFDRLQTAEKDRKYPSVVFQGKGCSNCGNSGYKGRIGIFELLNVSDHIKHVIGDSTFSLDKLQEAARGEGMRNMFEDGLEKARLGLTTLDEVLRVIRE